MKQIKKISLIFVLLFAMVGLSGCGGSKIANEYYEFNDWLNENISLKMQVKQEVNTCIQ